MKVLEKIYYISLLSLAFVCYKSPSILTYLFVDNPQMTIPFFSFNIIFFSLVGMWLEKRSKEQVQKTKKLKEKLKDTKRMLISHMDPVLVEAVKEIVKNDMRQEIDQMRNSDEGCSLKCKLIV